MTHNQYPNEDLRAFIEQDAGITLKRKSSTRGGEYAGPCPNCGGTDRFLVWPNNTKGVRFWCRQCKKGGTTTEHYLQRVRGIHSNTSSTRRRDTYVPDRKSLERSRAEQDPGWRRDADHFVQKAQSILWTEHGQKALGYLRDRGLTDAVIQGAKLGFNPFDQYPKWGDEPKENVTLPRGIVIPIYAYSQLLGISIRTSPHTGITRPKYFYAKGSANCLYNVDAIRHEGIVVLTEGVFDALALKSVIGTRLGDTPIACIATGSTTGGHRDRWVYNLIVAERILVAFDNDENGAGDKGSEWWLQQMNGNIEMAVRATPTRKDVNEMVMTGEDMEAWIRAHL